jgi:osmotically-inducible protein OsmY
MNDEQLRDQVIARLNEVLREKAAHIGVTAEKGVVTLTGHVTHYADKEHAVDTALMVPGVLGVARDIELRPREGRCDADDDIAVRATQALARDARLPSKAIKVEVEDGWVIVSGTVSSADQREAIEEDLRPIARFGFTNHVRIVAAPAVAGGVMPPPSTKGMS